MNYNRADNKDSDGSDVTSTVVVRVNRVKVVVKRMQYHKHQPGDQTKDQLIVVKVLHLPTQ